MVVSGYGLDIHQFGPLKNLRTSDTGGSLMTAYLKGVRLDIYTKDEPNAGTDSGVEL